MSSMNDCCLPVKNKPKSFVVNNFCGNKDAKEFSNLNLNQFCNKSFDSVQSNSKSSFNKEFERITVTENTFFQKPSEILFLWNWDYKCVKGIAATFELKDYKFDGRKNSFSDSSLKIWNSEIVKNEAKKRWMNDISSSSSSTTTTNNNNNSTLSLHIAAYENSVAAVTKDSFGNENQSLKMKKIDSVLVRKRKIAKHTFVGSKFCIIQNPFEFPRQQNDQPANPEVMQFKSSQQLADPNQANASNQQGQNSEIIKINASWNDLSKLDSELQLAANRLEIKKFRQLKITVFGSKEYVNVQLATDDETHIPIPSSKPSTPIKQKEATTNNEILSLDKNQKNVKTAEIGTQTEPWKNDQKQERVLVSSFAFAPYSLKAGKQIKCIQVNFVKVSQ